MSQKIQNTKNIQEKYESLENSDKFDKFASLENLEKVDAFASLDNLENLENPEKLENLERWGWNSHLESSMKSYADAGLLAGRVVRENRHVYRLAAAEGMLQAEISGAFRYKAVFSSDFPVIGDWVAFRKADDHSGLIEAVLPRNSSFSRKAAGEAAEEQVLAANIDAAAVVFAINGGRNFTEGALERYLTLVWNSGAEPYIFLNKADLCSEEERRRALNLAERTALGVPVHLTSAVTSEGLSHVKISAGRTMVLIGPSGVGKSALLNAMAGTNLQATGAQRSSDLKGRHTTTHRELFMLDSSAMLLPGVMIIDSPGLKEIQLWADTQSVDAAFSDIEELAEECKFNDCSHQGEPGCAVQRAIRSGELDSRRFENYQNMLREVRFLQTKQSQHAAREERIKWKQIAKLQKSLKKERKH